MIAGLKRYSEMRDSGVAWLGQVPEHWAMSRAKPLLRRVQRPVEDGAGVVTCFRDGVVTLRSNRRVAGFTEALKEIGYQGIRKGDLVIHAMDAFAGAIGVSDSDGKGTPVYAVCEPSPLANASYFARLTREMARNGWILALAKGIRERSTDFRYDTFSAQQVPLPPLKEQEAIVRFLDHADRRIWRSIAAKQKMIRLLEEQKAAIVHQAVTRGLNTDIPLKPSGVDWLGDIPTHWTMVRVGRIADLLTGFPFSSEGFSLDVDNIRLLRGVNVAPGSLRWDDVVRWPATQTAHLAHYELKVGDIVLGMDRPIIQTGTRVAQVAEADLPSLLLQRVARIRAGSEVRLGYLYLLLGGAGFARYLAPIFTGISVPHLSPTQIKGFPVALPSLEEQDAILAHVDAVRADLDRAANLARREIELLSEYRTRLVADVVTGKLDVSGAAAMLPDLEPEMLDLEDQATLDEEAEVDSIEVEEEFT